MNTYKKTRKNTSYHIEKWTCNIVEITTYMGYITTNVVHFTRWDEDENEILKEFKSRLEEE